MMRVAFASCTVVALLTTAQALPSATSAAQVTTTAPSRAVFVRVYPVDTQGLTKPLIIRPGRMLPDQKLNEIAARVELEITVGLDGRVRDAMVKRSTGGPRVDADALRAAANSAFQAGTLNGEPVAVRMPLNLTVPGR